MTNRRSRVSDEIRATSAQIDTFTADMETFLRRELPKILRRLEQGKLAPQEAVSIIGSVQSQLEAAGLTKKVRALREIYAQALTDIKRDFATLGEHEALSSADKVMVEALITLDTKNITNRLETYTDNTKATLMRSILGGEDINVSELIGAGSPLLASQLNAEVNTALATFSRSVTAAKAEELGFTLMIYLGPDDAITRPFCHRVLNKNSAIYTLADIKAMDNGTKGKIQALTGGGGYNCRHQWRPISEQDARAEGWKPA